ncbi:MAG: M1 family peptidase, partial [Bacteroidota bacterium]
MAMSLFLVGAMALLPAQNTSNHGNKFEQLGQLLRDPNVYRAADGAPGPQYWQQRADYVINCTLDVDNQRLMGEEEITYYNESPQPLTYLWFQLDENQHDHNAENLRFDPSSIQPKMSEGGMVALERYNYLEKDHGFKIRSVKDIDDKDLPHIINRTMMRVDLPEPLQPGESFDIKITWDYYLINRVGGPTWGRGGYEYFEDNDNYLFTIVQWYPRLCVYSDFEGWQNKQFTGRGEFAL